jgi:hypothetical protein
VTDWYSETEYAAAVARAEAAEAEVERLRERSKRTTRLDAGIQHELCDELEATKKERDEARAYQAALRDGCFHSWEPSEGCESCKRREAEKERDKWYRRLVVAEDALEDRIRERGATRRARRHLRRFLHWRDKQRQIEADLSLDTAGAGQ